MKKKVEVRVALGSFPFTYLIRQCLLQQEKQILTSIVRQICCRYWGFSSDPKSSLRARQPFWVWDNPLPQDRLVAYCNTDTFFAREQAKLSLFITQASHMGNSSIFQALHHIHKVSSYQWELTVLLATWVAQHCCPGKIKSLQVGENCWQPPMLANCCVHMHTERFPISRGFLSHEERGCVFRGSRRLQHPHQSLSKV